MNFTGERFIVNDSYIEIALEHLHRYKAIEKLCIDKNVLDLACGEGYGSNLISKVAKSVYGIDISVEAIEHAQQHYVKDNLQYIQGSAEKLPFENHSLDVIVSFETIEHIEQELQEKFLNEVIRVLKPDGIFICSTPNKLNYSDKKNYNNSYHVKEFYEQEYEDFLSSYFEFNKFYFQNLYFNSVLLSKDSRLNKMYSIKKNECSYDFDDLIETSDFEYIISISTNTQSAWNTIESSLLIDKDNEHFSHQLKRAEYAESIVKERDYQIGLLQDEKNKELKRAEYAESIVKERDYQIGLLQDEKTTYKDYQIIKIKSFIKKKLKKYLPNDIYLFAKKIYFYYKQKNVHFYNKHKLNLNEYLAIENKIDDNVFKNQEIDIIVPIYNGYDYIEPLFNSIFKNTSCNYRLIVIDDCSNDSRVLPLLETILKNHGKYMLIKNEINLGFVKSVNKAAAEANNHFVILNSDTEVPDGWLQRLMYPLFKDESIATTTPFTNSGTICSFPNYNEDNDIFYNLSVNEIDSAFKMISWNKYIQIPTGVGFCMGVNFNVYKKIGLFDEETFGRGYGEENDFCQRAIKAGFKNIHVPNLFVYHKHGGSFSSDEKKKLIEKNYQNLLNKHPNYEKDVNKCITDDEYKDLRVLLQIMIFGVNSKYTNRVYFDHSLGGGATLYLTEIIKNLVNNEFNNLYVIKYSDNKKSYQLNFYKKGFEANYEFENIEEVFDFLNIFHFKEIFINELVSYPIVDIELILKKSLEAKDKYNAELTVPIHDYFMICPSYTLLNDKMEFCNLPSLEDCQQCLKNENREFFYFYKNVSIQKWREKWGDFLAQVDKIVCFSFISKELILKTYNNINETKIEHKPHQVKNIKPLQCTETKNKILNIGILGAINEAKGSLIIKSMIDAIEKEKLDVNIVVIGEINQSIKSNHIEVTGRYQQNQLETIILEKQIDIFFIPSIWPETFSYTSEEIMMMELPLAVFNIGAPAERVKKYKKGLIIEKIDSEYALDAIVQWSKNGF